jgi:hypothetical protein
MITIFVDFRQFSAKKLTFLLKPNIVGFCCKNGYNLSTNRNFFFLFFGENFYVRMYTYINPTITVGIYKYSAGTENKI